MSALTPLAKPSPQASSYATVFIIEPSNGVRRNLSAALNRAGYRTVMARDNSQAIERLWWLTREATTKKVSIGRYVNAIVVCRSASRPINRSLLGSIKKIRSLAQIPVISFLTDGEVNKPDGDRLVNKIKGLII